MMRKIFATAAAVILATGFALTLAACSGGENADIGTQAGSTANLTDGAAQAAPHEHTYSGEWLADADSHFRMATCGHPAEERGAHDFADGVCRTCGYVADYTEGLELELSADGSSYIVTGIGSAEQTEVVLPSHFNSLPVTGIAWNAFEGLTTLESIEIAGTIEYIGGYAFAGCAALREIVIPDGVKAIETHTFSDCIRLTEITLPQSIGAIGGYAFAGCTALEQAEIPSSVKDIGSSAFKGCKSLKSATVPDGVEGINPNTFSNCTALEEIYLPESLINISGSAFYNCVSLKNIYYAGTESMFALISIGHANQCFSAADVFYGS